MGKRKPQGMSEVNKKSRWTREGMNNIEHHCRRRCHRFLLLQPIAATVAELLHVYSPFNKCLIMGGQMVRMGGNIISGDAADCCSK